MREKGKERERIGKRERGTEGGKEGRKERRGGERERGRRHIGWNRYRGGE